MNMLEVKIELLMSMSKLWIRKSKCFRLKLGLFNFTLAEVVSGV